MGRHDDDGFMRVPSAPLIWDRQVQTTQTLCGAAGTPLLNLFFNECGTAKGSHLTPSHPFCSSVSSWRPRRCSCDSSRVMAAGGAEGTDPWPAASTTWLPLSSSSSWWGWTCLSQSGSLPTARATYEDMRVGRVDNIHFKVIMRRPLTILLPPPLQGWWEAVLTPQPTRGGIQGLRWLAMERPERWWRGSLGLAPQTPGENRLLRAWEIPLVFFFTMAARDPAAQKMARMTPPKARRAMTSARVFARTDHPLAPSLHRERRQRERQQ